MRLEYGFTVVLGLMAASSDSLAEETAGIGAALANDDQGIYIRAILPDTPAAASKALQAGNHVLAIASGDRPPVDTKGLAIEECVSLIRGPTGTTVRLTVVPTGKDVNQARVISIVRGEINAISRWGDGQRIAAGASAPDTPMSGLGAQSNRRLSDYRGRVVVLSFWATWCAPCKRHIAQLQSLAEKNPAWKDGVVLIAASADEDQAPAREHVSKADWYWTTNVWIDVDVLKAWHVNALPTTYLIDRQGKVVDFDDNANVEQAANRLLAEE